MATWAKGIDFKNSGNTTRIGGVGVYGSDTTPSKIYLGLGTEPWSQTGLEITSSNISFKGNKIYHAGSKPTPAEIGAAASSHTHSYLPLSGGTITSTVFGPLIIKRSGSTNAASIQFVNDNGTLGSVGMSGGANTGLIRWNTDTNVSYTILDTGNYKTYVTPANIGAAASSHSHSYLPLSGGSLTGKINNSYTTGTYLAGNQGNTLVNSTAAAGSYTMLFRYPSTNGYFTTGGYQNKYLLQYTAKTTVDAGTNSVTKSVTLLDESGNTAFPGTVSAASFSGSISGNASTATTLQTARTLTIGSTGKSFNGSANVSWSLAEIGAAASSHTHNYAGSSSAGGAATSALACTGNSATATKLQTARTLFGKSFDGSGNVAGKALVYGNYTSTASSRYTNGALEVRENGLVGSAQSDIGYAPQLGFHWSGRIAATLAMSSSGEFQFINQAGTGYSNVRGGTFYGALSGNATTATTLQTTRTINGTSFNGSANITTANWGTARTLTIGNTGKSVNGSANVSWSLSEIGAAASSHTHNYAASTSAGGAANLMYLPRVTGSTVSANYQPGGNRIEAKEFGNDCTNTPVSGYWYHILTGQGSDANYNTQLALGMTTQAAYYRYRNAGTWGSWKQLAFTDSSISGNSGSATKLQTARTINGTSFNGTANITTANWGTARTITIGNTGKSVNGSGNISWSLSEIGAAASSHSHSYLPISGGTLTGRTIVSNGTSADAFSSAQLEVKATGSKRARLTLHSEGLMYASVSTAGGDVIEAQTERNGLLRHRNANGYGDMGARNTSYFHFSTDRPRFYFYQPVEVNSDIQTNAYMYCRAGVLYLGQGSNASYVAFYDSSGTRKGYVGKGSPDNNLIYLSSDVEKTIVTIGHFSPSATKTYWLGTNSPDRKWKGVCCEGGVVGASDIASKENIERLDGTIVSYNEVTREIKEFELSNYSRSNKRALENDYYEFIKDRFKPTYYNYKLTEHINEETQEYVLDPEDEYKMLKNVGFLAQDYDLENDKVAQEFIFKNPDGELSYNHMSYVTVGMIALQEATKKIESLENELNELKEYIKNKL